MVPRAILHVPSVPLLGTGKVDYPAVLSLVEQTRIGAQSEAIPA
jgi:hypothetical protein